MGRKPKTYGSTQEITLEDIKSLLRRNPNASAKYIAKALGIGRSTLFYILQKKFNTTLEELRKQVFEEAKVKEEQEIRRQEIKELPPTSFEEFLKYETIKNVKRLLDMSTLSSSHKSRVLRYIYDVCKVMNVAPSQIDKDVLIDYGQYLLDSGRYSSENQVRIIIKIIAKWLQIKLPPSVEISEYEGKYKRAGVYFIYHIKEDGKETIVRKFKEARLKLLEIAKEILPKKDYEFIHDVMILLHRGMRAEGLTTLRWKGYVKLNIEPYEFIAFETKEKGKKGKKPTWTRILPLSDYRRLYNPKRFPLSEGERKKAGNLLKKIFTVWVERYKDLLDPDTIAILKKGKVFHIWRHSYAHELLESLRWNIYLVARLVGWKKVENVKIYGTPDVLELLSKKEKEHIPTFF